MFWVPGESFLLLQVIEFPTLARQWLSGPIKEEKQKIVMSCHCRCPVGFFPIRALFGLDWPPCHDNNIMIRLFNFLKTIHFPRTTLPCDDAVTFRSRDVAFSNADFHPVDGASSWAHNYAARAAISVIQAFWHWFWPVEHALIFAGKLVPPS